MVYFLKRTSVLFLAFLCISGLAITFSVIRPNASHPAYATATPAGGTNNVYFASNDGYVYSLNATTGTLNWKHNIGVAVVSPVAVNGGIVYVPANTTIDALNATTGKPLWTAPASSPYYSTSFKPTIVNGVVYDSADGDVFAFNASNGALIWHDYGSQFGGANTAPVFSNNVLYFGSHDSCLVSVNAQDGSAGLEICTGYGVQARPTVANGMVYFCPNGPVGKSGNVDAVSVQTNQIIWSYQTTQGPSDAQAAVGGGVVYVGAGKSVYAMNATTGANIWARFLSTSVGTAGTTIANGLVYVGGANGQVYAIKQQSSNGQIVWTYTAGGAITVIPVIG